MEWFLATEDLLSSALAKKLLRSCFGKVEIVSDLGLSGSGKLYRAMTEMKFIRLAEHNPLLVLTDLDSKKCAPSLRAHWCSGLSLPPKLFFRIVVREAESWLMADVDNFSRQSGITKGKLPRDIETISAPKEKLLEMITKHGNRRFKEILPRKGSASKVSPVYNNILVEFVENYWDPTKGAFRSPSLKKAIERLRSFNPRA